jgi:hypothetical protein
MLRDEITKRTQEFKGLSPAEESRLLALTAAQKRLIADQDRKHKNEFLTRAPKINNAGVKTHDKFKAFNTMVQNATKGDVSA